MRAALIIVLAVTALGALAVFTVPIPFVDGYVARLATQAISDQLPVPAGAAPAQITIKGGPILPQVLTRHLSEIDILLPDLAIGGAQHATFAATLRGVSPTGTNTTHADSLKATITIPFAHLPAAPGQPKASFARAPDGALAVTVSDPGKQSSHVTATVFLKLNIHGEKVIAVPQWFMLFGKRWPASRVAAVTGGPRTQPLPHLPTGLTYRSITPEKDGLHVALGGVVTTPLSALPTNVGGRTISYEAENGLLGIKTTVQVPPLVNLPLTILTTPRLDPGHLTLVPRAVRILGRDRPPTDPIARIVLSQIKQEDLGQDLPPLPPGIAYRGVTVTSAGVKVTVGGVTVRPFSTVSAGPSGGTYGAQDGLLTARYTGQAASGAPLPITILSRPRIVGTALVVEPQTILILGTPFSPAEVEREVNVPTTRYPLQALPNHLHYTGVDVLNNALRLRVSGQDVTLVKGLFAPSTPS